MHPLSPMPTGLTVKQIEQWWMIWDDQTNSGATRWILKSTKRILVERHVDQSQLQGHERTGLYLRKRSPGTCSGTLTLEIHTHWGNPGIPRKTHFCMCETNRWRGLVKIEPILRLNNMQGEVGEAMVRAVDLVKCNSVFKALHGGLITGHVWTKCKQKVT